MQTKYTLREVHAPYFRENQFIRSRVLQALKKMAQSRCRYYVTLPQDEVSANQTCILGTIYIIPYALIN
jgi:hypothetical protein